MIDISGFYHFMFDPKGQPWYNGAFWSNQTQWTVVWVPTVIFAYWRGTKKANKRHQDLKTHISHEHNKSRRHLEKQLSTKRK